MRHSLITVVLAIFILMLLFQADASGQRKSKATPPQARPLQVVTTPYPGFGLELKVPIDYYQAPAVKLGEVVRLVVDAKPKRTFVIDAIPAEAQTLAEYVADVKQRDIWKGATEQETTLGGQPAVRLVKPADVAKDPREAILAKRDRYIFTLSRLSTDGRAAKRDFEILRSGWKWLPFESAHKHLIFADGERSFFNGRLKVPVAENMRPFLGEDHPKLGVFDYRRSAFSMIVDIQVGPNDGGLPLDRLKEAFGAKLVERMGLQETITWKTLAGSTPSVCTQTLKGKEGTETAKSSFRMGLAELDSRTVLVFTLTLTTPDAEERLRFEDGFVFMLEYMTVMKPNKTKGAP